MISEELFTEFDEERAVTARRVGENQFDQMSIRIKYLEKDNKDLELDLEDVDATLQINKNIINALIDSKDDPNMSFKQAIAGFQQEIESMEQRNK